jgi:hypothetical protein
MCNCKDKNNNKMNWGKDDCGCGDKTHKHDKNASPKYGQESGNNNESGRSDSNRKQ